MNHKKFLSLTICLCLLVTVVSAVAYAAPTDGFCPHHTVHDASCGYVEYKAEQACTHVCSTEQGCVAAAAEVACDHVHNPSVCSYAPAVSASCAHTINGHDVTCGFAAAVPGVDCSHKCIDDLNCTVDQCAHIHDTVCGYVEAVTGSACTHVCSTEQGCVAAAAEVACNHVHEGSGCAYAPAVTASCAHTAHDAACGYAAEVPEVTCTFNQTCADCNPFMKAVVTVASAGSYDGTEKKPAVTVTINGAALVENTDYTLAYSNNVNAGTGTAIVTVTGIGTYAGHETTKKFSISPAGLNVTINSFTKTYGELDPTFTYTVTGLIAGDDINAVLGGTLLRRDQSENVGEYVISGGSLAIINGVTNYGIQTVTLGKLTIEEKALTVTADDQAIIYGTALDTTKVAADALVTGDTLASATLTPSTTDVVADGTITPKDAVIKNAAGINVTGNYEITYVPAKLTIDPKEVTPTVELTPNRFAYTGQALKPTTVKVMDGTTVIPATEYSLSYANNVNIGTASVSVNDVAGGNYIIKPVSAPFSIVQRQAYAIIAGNGQSYVYTNYYGISFTTNGPAANLTSIYIDNQPVSNAYYTVAPYTAIPGVNGSVITLNTGLMNSNLLSNGTHSIVFNYSDGAVAGTFIKGAASINGVKTGDDSAPGMMAIFMCLGLVGAAAILPALRKQRS